MKKIKIGWVGLGNMGIPMARNLLIRGFPVSVYNRTREKEKELIKLGASSAESLAHLAQISDIIITMVSDDKAVEEIYNPNNGLLTNPMPGTLMIDMSTLGVQTSKKLAMNCNDKLVHFLEAKVSGSVKPAEEGKLLIMAGGEHADYQKALPVLESLGSPIFYLGDIGTASAAKLSINYFLALTLQGLSETVLFAQKLGIHTEDILTLINESACGSGVTRLKAQSILKSDFSPAFALKLLTKDLRLAEKEGMIFPLSVPLIMSFQNASQMGYGERDVISIIRFLDNTVGSSKGL
jgi:3-hydroxyisobutyrate dehydrogenase